MAESEVIPLFTLKTMTGRLHRYAVEGTQVTFTFVTNEVTSKTEANPTWTNIDLEAETYAFWVGVTDELMEDTFSDIGAQIRVQAVEALLNTVESQLLDGSGSPVTGALRNGSVNVKRSGSISILNVDWDDIKTLIDGLPLKKQKADAVFIMHPTIWDILINDKDAMGRYFWDVSQAGPRIAKGYPVKLSDNMPDIGDDAADKAFIVFGNPRYILYGIRMGLEFRYFDQTMYALQDDENFWRARTRFAGVVAIPTNFAVLKTLAS